MKTEKSKIHPFESTGCGVAPFRVVGFEHLGFRAAPGAPEQAGGVCDHCGTAIKNAYVIAEAGGNRFRVGSSCVAKTADKTLLDGRKAIDRKRRAIAKVAKQRAEVADLLTDLARIIVENPGILDQPLNDGTFRDWFSGSSNRKFSELPKTRDTRFVRIRWEMAQCQAWSMATGRKYIWEPHCRTEADRAQWREQLAFNKEGNGR